MDENYENGPAGGLLLTPSRPGALKNALKLHNHGHLQPMTSPSTHLGHQPINTQSNTKIGHTRGLFEEEGLHSSATWLPSNPNPSSTSTPLRPLHSSLSNVANNPHQVQLPKYKGWQLTQSNHQHITPHSQQLYPQPQTQPNQPPVPQSRRFSELVREVNGVHDGNYNDDDGEEKEAKEEEEEEEEAEGGVEHDRTYKHHKYKQECSRAGNTNPVINKGQSTPGDAKCGRLQSGCSEDAQARKRGHQLMDIFELLDETEKDTQPLAPSLSSGGIASEKADGETKMCLPVITNLDSSGSPAPSQSGHTSLVVAPSIMESKMGFILSTAFTTLASTMINNQSALSDTSLSSAPSPSPSPSSSSSSSSLAVPLSNVSKADGLLSQPPHPDPLATTLIVSSPSCVSSNPSPSPTMIETLSKQVVNIITLSKTLTKALSTIKSLRSLLDSASRFVFTHSHLFISLLSTPLSALIDISSNLATFLSTAVWSNASPIAQALTSSAHLLRHISISLSRTVVSLLSDPTTSSNMISGYLAFASSLLSLAASPISSFFSYMAPFLPGSHQLRLLSAAFPSSLRLPTYIVFVPLFRLLFKFFLAVPRTLLSLVRWMFTPRNVLCHSSASAHPALPSSFLSAYPKSVLSSILIGFIMLRRYLLLTERSINHEFPTLTYASQGTSPPHPSSASGSVTPREGTTPYLSLGSRKTLQTLSSIGICSTTALLVHNITKVSLSHPASPTLPVSRGTTPHDVLHSSPASLPLSSTFNNHPPSVTISAPTSSSPTCDVSSPPLAFSQPVPFSSIQQPSANSPLPSSLHIPPPPRHPSSSSFVRSVLRILARLYRMHRAITTPVVFLARLSVYTVSILMRPIGFAAHNYRFFVSAYVANHLLRYIAPRFHARLTNYVLHYLVLCQKYVHDRQREAVGYLQCKKQQVFDRVDTYKRAILSRWIAMRLAVEGKYNHYAKPIVITLVDKSLLCYRAGQAAVYVFRYGELPTLPTPSPDMIGFSVIAEIKGTSTCCTVDSFDKDGNVPEKKISVPSSLSTSSSSTSFSVACGVNSILDTLSDTQQSILKIPSIPSASSQVASSPQRRLNLAKIPSSKTPVSTRRGPRTNATPSKQKTMTGATPTRCLISQKQAAKSGKNRDGVESYNNNNDSGTRSNKDSKHKHSDNDYRREIQACHMVCRTCEARDPSTTTQSHLSCLCHATSSTVPSTPRRAFNTSTFMTTFIPILTPTTPGLAFMQLRLPENPQSTTTPSSLPIIPSFVPTQSLTPCPHPPLPTSTTTSSHTAPPSVPADTQPLPTSTSSHNTPTDPLAIDPTSLSLTSIDLEAEVLSSCPPPCFQFSRRISYMPPSNAPLDADRQCSPQIKQEPSRSSIEIVDVTGLDEGRSHHEGSPLGRSLERCDRAQPVQTDQLDGLVSAKVVEATGKPGTAPSVDAIYDEPPSLIEGFASSFEDDVNPSNNSRDTHRCTSRGYSNGHENNINGEGKHNPLESVSTPINLPFTTTTSSPPPSSTLVAPTDLLHQSLAFVDVRRRRTRTSRLSQRPRLHTTDTDIELSQSSRRTSKGFGSFTLTTNRRVSQCLHARKTTRRVHLPPPSIPLPPLPGHAQTDVPPSSSTCSPQIAGLNQVSSQPAIQPNRVKQPAGTLLRRFNHSRRSLFDSSSTRLSLASQYDQSPSVLSTSSSSSSTSSVSSSTSSVLSSTSSVSSSTSSTTSTSISSSASLSSSANRTKRLKQARLSQFFTRNQKSRRAQSTSAEDHVQGCLAELNALACQYDSTEKKEATGNGSRGFVTEAKFADGREGRSSSSRSDIALENRRSVGVYTDSGIAEEAGQRGVHEMCYDYDNSPSYADENDSTSLNRHELSRDDCEKTYDEDDAAMALVHESFFAGILEFRREGQENNEDVSATETEVEAHLLRQGNLSSRDWEEVALRSMHLNCGVKQDEIKLEGDNRSEEEEEGEETSRSKCHVANDPLGIGRVGETIVEGDEDEDEGERQEVEVIGTTNNVSPVGMEEVSIKQGL